MKIETAKQRYYQRQLDQYHNILIVFICIGLIVLLFDILIVKLNII